VLFQAKQSAKQTQTACFGQKRLVDMNTDDLFNRNSMKKEVFFLGISVIWTAASGAIQPAEISDEDWASAARISLASAHRFLPVAATAGFSTWQPAMLASMAEFGQNQAASVLGEQFHRDHSYAEEDPH
jgi:hypothetical protein